MNTEQLYLKLADAIKETGSTPCQESDPDLFFAGTDEIASGWQQAVKLCKKCPVMAECLEYSLAADELFGVWGGLTANQRRSIRRGKTSPQLAMSADLTARPHLRQIAKRSSQ